MGSDRDYGYQQKSVDAAINTGNTVLEEEEKHRTMKGHST